MTVVGDFSQIDLIIKTKPWSVFKTLEPFEVVKVELFCFNSYRNRTGPKEGEDNE